jgi:tetratricopeptide (TPR) repeat protein
MTKLRCTFAASMMMFAMTICAPFTAHGAGYWAYSYKGIEVTSSDGAERTKDIAHDLSRLDAAITVVLRIPASDWRPPTQVYSMPNAVFSRVRGKKDDSLSLYMTNPFGNTIEINASNTGDNKLYGAFYGYTGSVLISAYSFRYPPWFVKGLSETFAGSTITKSGVTIGAPSGRSRTLFTGKLIPTRELLAVHWGDPQLRSPDYSAMYDAESWLLVHLIVLEGKYHSNFFDYFQRCDRGEDQAQAFASSFDISYEDLDKMLAAVLQTGKVDTKRVAIPEEKDAGAATRLTDAEAAGRLAALAARHSAQPDEALQMANEAIALSATNPDALFALAYVQIRRTEYSEALQAAERLCAADSPTEKQVAECGQLFSSLAAAIREGKATVGVEAQTLTERARRYYDEAITMDPEDLASSEGMASLLATMRNREYSQAFLPRAQKTLSAHPHASSLARAMAGMCADMGDTVMAINYASMWQIAALSGAERDAAAAYVSRLKASLERNNMRQP